MFAEPVVVEVVTTPVVKPTTATVKAPLIQVPPDGVPVNTVLEPSQRSRLPVIEGGALTVIV
jgi:hypothetical protein